MTRRQIRIPAVVAAVIAMVLLSPVLWNRGAAPRVIAPAAAADEIPGLDHALQLSSAFRYVARKTLPAVVSIRSTGRVVKETVERNNPFLNDPFFRRFFGNDPRFREFMENGPVEREHRMPGGSGSGFIISPDGVVMTNSHVVADAEEVVVKLSDGREFTATDIRNDPDSDIAVIHIRVDERLPFLPLGDDAELEIGDWVLAFGSPFGLHRTVTQGIISAKSRSIQQLGTHAELLQTDAAINPGNSGGPLVNLRGEVIGINTAISTSSGGYDGVGFAVPVGLARWISDQLLRTGDVRRAYVGIEMQSVTPELSNAFNLRIPHGIAVTGVIEGSPADVAGIQQGDIVTHMDGRPIKDNLNMLGVVERLKISKTYPIRVLRDGREVDFRIMVTERPKDFGTALRSQEGSPADDDDASRIAALSIEVQNVTAELAEKLGIPTVGVVITAVEPGSPAHKVGVRPEMVISRVGNQDVKTVAEFRKLIQDNAEKGNVLLLVRISQGNSSIARFVAVPLQSSS